MRQLLISLFIADAVFISVFFFTLHSEYEVIRGAAVFFTLVTTAIFLYIWGTWMMYTGSKDLWRDFNDL